MAYKSLQQFIDLLELHGDLIRVKSFVSPRLEMAEIADRFVKHGREAILFENNGTDFPVLMNMMGTERRMCLALGVNHLDDIGKEIIQLFHSLSAHREGMWEKLKLLPSLKQLDSWFPVHFKGKGECQEVVMVMPDLCKLPVITCWPYDGGPFFTLPVVHTKDPESGTRNVGMYRMQVYDAQTTGMHWHLHKNSARHYQAYRRLKKRMPVAVTLGGDPVYTYAATAPMPDQVDEYLLAGFLRKKKVEMVRCLSQDVEVPRDVDIVIEGYVDPAEELWMEGPFGDHTGFYSLPDLYPVFHVTCITHCKKAIFPATIVGIPPQEDFFLGKATERIFLNPIRIGILPEVVDMHMPAEGVFHNLVLVMIRSSYPGQAVKVMNSLWGAGQMMLNKVMVVVEDSQVSEGTQGGERLELQDYQAVFQRVMENFVPARDVYFGRGPIDVLDHASDQFAFGGKMGIDGTQKVVALNGKVAWWEWVKVVTLTKTFPGQVREETEEFLQLGLLKGKKILVFTEDFIDPQDISTIIWRVLNNIDPDRDCFVVSAESQPEGVLAIDGTRKSKVLDACTRPWPNCTVSDRETIQKIDEQWDTYCLGAYIPSPSNKYQFQVYPGRAKAEE